MNKDNESYDEDLKDIDEEETSKNDEFETDEDEQEETVEELKERLAKSEELANNQKIRAEKAEAKSKGKPKQEKPKETQKENYSLQDIRALSDVPDEDVEEVVNFAKFKGIDISEAKKNTVVQTILKNRIEERKTAEATNTGGSKRASTKVSGSDMLDEASKTGNLPEKDEDIEAMARSRYAPRT